MSEARRFYDFVFKCMEPYLSIIDLLSLSYVCKQFHTQLDMKTTMYPMFKRRFIDNVLKGETNEFLIDFLFHMNVGYVVSGSSAVCTLTGDNYFSDVDIYYSKRRDDIKLEDTVKLGDIEFRHYGNHKILRLTDLVSVTTRKKYQFIRYCKQDFDNQNGLKKLMTQRFDLDFCKVFFTAKSLSIPRIDSILYRSGNYTLPCEHNPNFVSEFKNLKFENIFDRIEKYKSRGFHIKNEDYIRSMFTVQMVFKSMNNREERQREKFIESKKAEAEIILLKNKIHVLRQKLLSDDEKQEYQEFLESQFSTQEEKDTYLSTHFGYEKINLPMSNELPEKIWMDRRSGIIDPTVIPIRNRDRNLDLLIRNKRFSDANTNSIIDNLIQEKIQEDAKKKRLFEEQEKSINNGAQIWFRESDPDEISYTNNKRFPHCVVNREIISEKNVTSSDCDMLDHPLFELKRRFIADFKTIYTVFCYCGLSHLIDNFFNPRFIPFDWISYNMPKFTALINSMYPTSCMSEEKKIKLIWKTIYSNWPNHYKFLN